MFVAQDAHGRLFSSRWSFVILALKFHFSNVHSLQNVPPAKLKQKSKLTKTDLLMFQKKLIVLISEKTSYITGQYTKQEYFPFAQISLKIEKFTLLNCDAE